MRVDLTSLYFRCTLIKCHIPSHVCSLTFSVWQQVQLPMLALRNLPPEASANRTDSKTSPMLPLQRNPCPVQLRILRHLNAALQQVNPSDTNTTHLLFSCFWIWKAHQKCQRTIPFICWSSLSSELPSAKQPSIGNPVSTTWLIFWS